MGDHHLANGLDQTDSSLVGITSYGALPDTAARSLSKFDGIERGEAERERSRSDPDLRGWRPSKRAKLAGQAA